MNLFAKNSPYYHILKYLLFLLKHPVYDIATLFETDTKYFTCYYQT